MKTIAFIILGSIALSYNASAQWSLCEGPYGGSISSIYADTVTGRLYAGSVGNINYSTDNGDNWLEGKLYVSTWSGLYYLSENGLSWNLLRGGLPETTNVASIASQAWKACKGACIF